jgi:3-phenylpropionate/trans-cinnamate dioxygenase ferredoxin subunit
MSWIRVADAESLPVGALQKVSVDGENIALCRLSETDIYAFEDACSHDDGPLSGGSLDGHVIECPRHGARFDVRSGAVLRMPAASPIETYPVRTTADGGLEIDLDED